MRQENRELLLKDICARLPYGVKINTIQGDFTLLGLTNERVFTTCEVEGCHNDFPIELIKPYLFPLSSMTEEEAKELSILYGIKDILSINITDEYIDFKVDDGFCSFERKTIWYNEIISSTETFDWLNKNHFDYRYLIPMGLAIDATELNIY